MTKLAISLCAFMLLGASFAAADDDDLPWKFDETGRSSYIVVPAAYEHTVSAALSWPAWVEAYVSGGIHRQGLVILLRSYGNAE